MRRGNRTSQLSADAQSSDGGAGSTRVRWGSSWPWALAVVVLAVAGVSLPVYWVFLLTTVAVSGLIARSVGVLTGQTGIITLCQMSFAAIGGWVVSWIALVWPTLPFPLLVLAGAIAAAPIGAGLGVATARIRGVELAVVTLGFAAALDLVLRQGAFPGVGSGTPVIPLAPFDDPRWYLGLSWAVFVLLQLLLWWARRGGMGLRWIAVGASERGAAALGVSVVSAKASAFAAAAALAGAAGGLLAGQYGLLTPDVFSPLTSVVVLATAVLCGASLASGAVLAGVFAVFVPEGLRRIGLPLDVGNALLALGAFDVLRRGTGGIAEQLRGWAQNRRFRDVRVTCTLPGAVVAAPTSAPVNGDSPILHVRGLTAAYGAQRALDSVDLTVGVGEVHALIGSNGAGKTTLIDAITGFLPTQQRSVRLGGEALDRLSAVQRAQHGVRRTFQQGRAIEALSVGEYLQLAAGKGTPAGSVQPATPAAANEQCAAATLQERVRLVREFFGVPEPDVPVRLLDAASRRVLEMAGALAAAPQLLLLDEPAAGLSDEESRALAACVREIPTVFGTAVLVIEHDMSFVRAAATRVTVLDGGRVLAMGASHEVFADPRVIAAYLGREAS